MTINDEIQAYILKRLESYKESLASGSAEDYSHYQRSVGICIGLKEAGDIIKDILNKRLYEEEDVG